MMENLLVFFRFFPPEMLTILDLEVNQSHVVFY